MSRRACPRRSVYLAAFCSKPLLARLVRVVNRKELLKVIKKCRHRFLNLHSERFRVIECEPACDVVLDNRVDADSGLKDTILGPATFPEQFPVPPLHPAIARGEPDLEAERPVVEQQWRV